jgi:uncharacterized protein Veg
MKKMIVGLDGIKQQILLLLGKNVDMTVNTGRKRIKHYTGKIGNIYPSVFTVIIKDDEKYVVKTYSYSDVLCGDVKLDKNNKA